MREVLTLQEACARAKLSDKTLYRALESRALIGSKVGAHWRIFADDLEGWLVSLQPREHHLNRLRARASMAPLPPRGSLRALEAVDEGSAG